MPAFLQVLRRFLLEKFGAERLAQGSGVVDVGGGRGEVSYALKNLNGIEAHGTHTYTRTHTRTHTHTRSHTHTGSHTYTHAHTRTHTHTHSLTHSHAHTRMLTPRWSTRGALSLGRFVQTQRLGFYTKNRIFHGRYNDQAVVERTMINPGSCARVHARACICTLWRDHVRTYLCCA